MVYLQDLINGILHGGIYALGALSFALIWGVMNIINLAHGSFIMLGAYTTLILFNYLHIDPFISIPVVFIIFFIFGYFIQKGLLNHVLKASMLMTLLITFGIDYVLTNGARLIFTADTQGITTSYSGYSFALGDFIRLPLVKLSALLVAILLAFLLNLFMNRTKLGHQITATSQDHEAAQLYGVNLKTIYAIVFGIGIGLAGVAGAMYGTMFPFNPSIGAGFTIKTFIVIVLGGLGNMYGALFGGLLLGIVEAIASHFNAGYADVVSFVIFVLVLILRPRGIAGKESVA